MTADLNDLSALATVVRAGGFRDGARASGVSASGLSEAVRRLEAKLGVRLLNRTTRSVALTEAARDGEVVRIDPAGPLEVRLGAAIEGLGVIHLFEDWPQPYLGSGALEPAPEHPRRP